MIIFDLDGTLALCEHRRHFVDPKKNPDCEQVFYYGQRTLHSAGWYYKDIMLMSEPPQRKQFIPDWTAFYEACDLDEPNETIINILQKLSQNHEISIWSGRCESVREKTMIWIRKHIRPFYSLAEIKMRPIGDSTPDDQLKERWLDEYYYKIVIPNQIEGNKPSRNIEMAFSSHQPTVDMWRRRGITCLKVSPGEF